MAKFLIEAKYTLEGTRGLRAEGGSARVAAVTSAIEAAGGKVESFYFAFGDGNYSGISGGSARDSNGGLVEKL